MKSQTKVRDNRLRAAVEPSHWVQAAIGQADAELMVAESSGATAHQDLFTSARRAIDELKDGPASDNIAPAVRALKDLSQVLPSGKERLYRAAESLEMSPAGPLPRLVRYG